MKKTLKNIRKYVYKKASDGYTMYKVCVITCYILLVFMVLYKEPMCGCVR